MGSSRARPADGPTLPPGGGAAWSVSLGALSALLAAVMAGCAQALQVALVPEQRLVTAVRPLVVDDQLRRVRGHQSAARPLTREHVTRQDDHAQGTPARRLVELAPRRVQHAVLVAGALDRRQRTKPWPQRGEAVRQSLELAQLPDLKR
jgi:hypothetical protein